MMGTTSKFPKAWYSIAQNPYRLKKYWYQRYVQDHYHELGFKNLQGPFETGVDFKGYFRGRPVRIEVERDYLNYFYHGHGPGWADVLVVGVLASPHPDMRPQLPPEIINLDPEAVLNYTEPIRRSYRNAKEAERVSKQEQERRWQTEAEVINPENYPAVASNFKMDEKLKWALSHPGVVIEEIRRVDGKIRFFLKEGITHDWEPCECGRGVLQPVGGPDLLKYESSLTEGQLADYSAGFNRPFRCTTCGRRVFIDRPGLIY